MTTKMTTPKDTAHRGVFFSADNENWPVDTGLYAKKKYEVFLVADQGIMAFLRYTVNR